MRKIVSVLLVLITLFSMSVAAALPCGAVNTNEKIVIVIDPGHGGIDGGTNTGIRLEKVYNLLLSQYLAEELRKNGNFEVHLTRTTDTYLKYLPRALNIIEKNADLLISMHCNSNTESYPNGSMAIVSVIDRFDATKLASRLLDAIASVVAIRKTNVQKVEDTGDSLGVYFWNAEKQWDMPSKTNLGQKSDYYSMITWSSKFGTPSIIVEHGYLSNANDRAILDNDANLRAIAKAEAAAIIQYYTGHTHTFAASKTVDYPSSCTLTGSRSYRCTVCGAKFETEKLPSAENEHFWRQDASMAPTCTADGYIHYICQISSNLNSKGYSCPVHERKEILPAKGHTLGEGTVQTDGTVKYECQTCSSVIVKDPNCPHDYREVERIDATCDKDGQLTSKCALCGAMQVENLLATEHNWTAGEHGFYVCSLCEAVGDLMPPPDNEIENDETGLSDRDYNGQHPDESDTDGEADKDDKEPRKHDPVFVIVLAVVSVQIIFAGIIIYLLMTSRRRRRTKKLSEKASAVFESLDMVSDAEPMDESYDESYDETYENAGEDDIEESVDEASGDTVEETSADSPERDTKSEELSPSITE